MLDPESKKCYFYVEGEDGRYHIVLLEENAPPVSVVAKGDEDDMIPLTFPTQIEAASFCTEASAKEYGLSLSEYTELVAEFVTGVFIKVMTNKESGTIQVFSNAQIVFELDSAAAANLVHGLTGALVHLMKN